MSDYISGHDIVIEYGILPGELLPRFINKGLIPLNPHNFQPIQVRELLFSLFGREDVEYFNDYIYANIDTTWEEYHFPLSISEISQKYTIADDVLDHVEISKIVNEALLDFVYERKKYEKLEALDQINRHGLPALPQAHVKVAAKKSKRTPTIHKNILIRRAERIWEVYPNMHPIELYMYAAFRRGIAKKNEEPYGEEFFRNCIKNKWPKPYAGPSKDLNIPNESIEALLQDL